MKGLSSGALQKITSFAQPREPFSAVRAAVSLTTCPMRRTASILRPVRVEPTFTELHTRSVRASASGMESINSASASVMPFATSAE